MDNALDRVVFGVFVYAYLQSTLTVDAAGNDLFPRSFLNQFAFPCDRCLVDRRVSLQDDAIHGDSVCWSDNDDITGLQIFDIDYLFDIILQANGGLWRQIGKFHQDLAGIVVNISFKCLRKSEQQQKDDRLISFTQHNCPNGSNTHQCVHIESVVHKKRAKTVSKNHPTRNRQEQELDDHDPVLLKTGAVQEKAEHQQRQTQNDNFQVRGLPK